MSPTWGSQMARIASGDNRLMSEYSPESRTPTAGTFPDGRLQAWRTGFSRMFSSPTRSIVVGGDADETRSHGSVGSVQILRMSWC